MSEREKAQLSIVGCAGEVHGKIRVALDSMTEVAELVRATDGVNSGRAERIEYQIPIIWAASKRALRQAMLAQHETDKEVRRVEREAARVMKLGGKRAALLADRAKLDASLKDVDDELSKL